MNKYILRIKLPSGKTTQTFIWSDSKIKALEMAELMFPDAKIITIPKEFRTDITEDI